MSNKTMNQALQDYFSLKSKGYKSSPLLPILDFVTGMLLCSIYIYVSSMNMFLSLISFIILALYATAFLEPSISGVRSVYRKLFDKEFLAKAEIINNSFTGHLYEIFDVKDEITIMVINKHSVSIENDLLKNKAICGYTILKIYDDIIAYNIIKNAAEKETNRIKNELEEKQALIDADTKIGSLFKELEDIKNAVTNKPKTI